MMPTYRHTQFGTLTIGMVVGVIVILAATIPFFGPHPITLTLIVVFALIATQFATLTVTIDRRSLRVGFGPGWIGREIPLASIRSAKATRTRWVEGWGIHVTARGLLYNIGGFDAVDLVLTDGRHVLVGTDEPGDLLEAVQEAIGRKDTAGTGNR